MRDEEKHLREALSLLHAAAQDLEAAGRHAAATGRHALATRIARTRDRTQRHSNDTAWSIGHIARKPEGE